MIFSNALQFSSEFWRPQSQFYLILDGFLRKQCLRQSLDLYILKTIDFVLPDIIFCNFSIFLFQLELTE